MSSMDLTQALITPLANAEHLVQGAINKPLDYGERSELSAPTNDVWRVQDAARRRSTMLSLTRRWKGVHGRNRRDGGAEEKLVEYLAIWLGLYFNGTPRPNIWQEIADLVDREGGATSTAFTMKQYGDVYRIERRRWVEREQRGIRIDGKVDFSGLSGIVTVVEHPMLLLPREEQRLSGIDPAIAELSQDDKPDAGAWLSATSLPILASRTSEAHADALLSCVTERLARLYCAFQVFSYTRKKFLLRAIWRRVKGDIARLRSELIDGQQRVVIVPAGQYAEVDSLPTCVLSTREGVVREFGQALVSPAGRGTFSRRQAQLRARIERQVDELLKHAPAEAAIVSLTQE